MITRLIKFCIWLTVGAKLVICSDLANVFDENQLGYYAFEKAGRNEFPPRIRTPPYHQVNIPCPGLTNDKLDSKDTLCGDLKRGYVPLNPMNVVIQNQHYPFELIKNKTLHFLARALPFLKEDHENIPKVFKISPTTGYNELYSNSDTNAPQTNYRSKRQISKATITKIEKSELNSNESSLIKNNHQNMSSSSSSISKKSKGVDSNDASSLQQESRQKGCEQNDGILCHVVHALAANSNSKSSSNDNGGLFSTMWQYYQAYKAAQNFNNFVQSFSTPIDSKSDNNEKAGNDQYSNRPILSQMLSAFNTMNNPQAGGTPSSNGNSNYNPLGALLEYFGNSNNNGGGFGSRKKKPSDYEEYMNGLAAASSSVQPTVAKAEAEQIQLAQPTPTACPSIEEYVTPVYARNYQGVWKYVVQIPHEGYFTQTLQRTKCVKGKCDFIDGQCKEANRWVSLLVAEVYYPNAKQPLSNMIAQPNQMKPLIYNSLNAMQNVNELTSKLNAPQLPSSTNAFNMASSSSDQNLASYDLFNGLLPANYNEYNHYDQTFARRASKNHQPANQQLSNHPQSANPKMAAYPSAGSPATAASFSMPQYQDFNHHSQEFNHHNHEFNSNNQYQTYQPNYNQLVNNQQQTYNANSIKQPIKNQALNPAAQAQIQQLIDLYQQQALRQQYLAQLSKSKPVTANTQANAAYSSLVDGLSSSGSMNYPTVVSQSGSNQPINQAQQSAMLNSKLSNDPKQNEIKPRSFDTISNQNILESTLMKSSYINSNNNEETAASNSDKVISNEMNAVNQASTDSNSMNNQATGSSSQANSEHNGESSSKENNEECDGYDSNGCYVIRVYYDWFLVNGSCKCWKPNAKSGFEILKKMSSVIGK